ncbi:SDR family oxidoreductase [Cohnella thailandensis]|uniref:SDR family oxidoreductase n=1 Tax=Cohnella thailandensis TaxID=557557 RepID=A0A841SZF9_9BACL|nr:SDR family oxidoreductase [Cohnella thailandensis]MBB6634171.1 SDR family oxidoreductase [Cohnella thailandensis]MBP1972331.1 3-oxoacyl-[acyl-carrier protein] reductase [Cohnella thailandensis]
MDKKLAGKAALITGASRGIGRTIAENLAQNGAKVVINYANRSEQAAEVVQAIKRNGGEATAIQADIGRLSELEKLYQETLNTFGKLDIVVNNAGIIITKPIGDVTEADYDRLFAINVKGTYFSCQLAAKHLESNGRIINFSTSVTGQMFPAYSLYAGSKGAVEQFTRQLAKELGRRNITINAVAPGPINTELFTVGKTPEQIQGLANMNAFGRLGETEDIAGVILFLASEESQWVTGQTLRVNGGFI